MARNQRFFQDGINRLENGFVVNVVRFTSAYDNGVNSRIAAKHWGTITTPDGVEISMGDSGMTTTQIKKLCSLESKNYNRGDGGDSKELRKLKSAIETLQNLGLDTTNIEAKIADLELADAERRAEIERRKRESSEAYRNLKKQIKKLNESREILVNAGLDTTDLDSKIAELTERLENC